MLREVGKLRKYGRRCWIPQQVPPDHWIGRVDRYIQGREPVFDNALDVVRLEVGESSEVPIAEGETVVVVADIQHLTKPGGQPIHEAEVAAVGAAPNAGWLEAQAKGISQWSLDLELYLLTIRLPHVEEELFLCGQEFPVQKVVQRTAVDGKKLGSLAQAEFGR